MPSLSLPLFGQSDPAPYRGSTPRSKASSASGAVKALQQRAQKIDTLRRLWRQPHTIQEISQISGYPIASVCSLKKCLERELVEVDQVEKFWPDGSVTKRTRWQIRQQA